MTENKILNQEKTLLFLDKFGIVFILLFQLVTSIVTLIVFDGTGHSGDSITHYLYAKYAFKYPELYFNHWAKPFFTLLASPFSQFGFIGIKTFNAIIYLFTTWTTYKTVKALKIKHAWIASLFIIFTPLFYKLSFSGLTEPLFALMTVVAVYLTLQKQEFLSALTISLLPFVRSEGLIIIGVFSLHFLIRHNWKAILALSAGHIIYSFAGYTYYQDILWIFTKIPYAEPSSRYGNGELFHFVEQLLYSIGIPLYILFWTGSIAGLWLFLKRKITNEILLLIFGSFFSFLVAHSLFWYLGIFNSMGLIRVMIGVFPLLSIICLIGLNSISWLLKKHAIILAIIQTLLISYVLIFPFTSNPSAIDWNKDMSLTKSEQDCINLKNYLHESNSLSNNTVLVYNTPYLSVILDIDHFYGREKLTKNTTLTPKQNHIYIWDNWFSEIEYNVTQEMMDNNSSLELIKTFEHFRVYKAVE